MRVENVKPLPASAELPPLELLRSFEAAARTLSFTQAAAELFLTQSAVSRQIQQLEASLGVLLFERRHRALALTEAGAVLRQVAITCTPGFASFWLIPRLARFTADHPRVDVRLSAKLEVLDRSRLDVAVRFVPIERGTGPALFEESVIPLCAPGIAQRLRSPDDLVGQTLLTIDAPHYGDAPTVDWEPWLEVMGLTNLRMKNSLRFTQYTDAVAAAVAGQGVVIGRLPLLRELVENGSLVAPFGRDASSRRAYFIETSRRAAGNADALDFVRWLRAEAEAARRS